MRAQVSIRTKILVGVVIVNLLGAVCVAVYLHQTFSGGLQVTARRSITLSKNAWEDITGHDGVKLDFAGLTRDGGDLVARMKKITGADYGVLLSKSEGSPKAYAALRTAAGKPNNWDEGDTYVIVGSTDEALASKMQLKTTPDAVPDIGKIVGIENGACAKTCHGSVKGQGDFWGVSWSNDSNSRAYAVVPISDASGKPVGLLYSIEDITAQADVDRTSLMQTLGVILFGLVAATVLIYFMLNAFILGRLTKMITQMEELGVRVAGGDFDARFQPDGTNDEIGQFEEFFAKYVDLTASMLKSLLAKVS